MMDASNDFGHYGRYVLFFIGGMIPLLIIFKHYEIFPSTSKGAKKLVRASGYPLFGSVNLMAPPKNMLQKLGAMCQQYGNLFEVYVLGQRIIVISDNQLAQEILAKRPGVFRRARNIGI